MKRIKKWLALYADDLLFGAGTGCLTGAAWMLSPSAGLGTLGALLLIYAVLISRGR